MLICIESDGELQISLRGLPPSQRRCLFQSEQMGKNVLKIQLCCLLLAHVCSVALLW